MTSDRFIPQAAGTSAPRQSPTRRPAAQVNPGDLQNELADAFPTGAAKGRTPAAEQPAISSADESNSTSEPSGAQAAPGQPTVPSFGPPETMIMRPAAVGAESRPQRSTESTPEITPIPAPAAAAPANISQPFTGRSTEATKQPSLGDRNVLVTNRAPIIATDIRGPKQILVGREATFRVRVSNQGETPAEGLEILVRVPSWADVVDAAPTNGTVAGSAAEMNGAVKWQLSRLESRASETIDLKLVPRNSRPLELGVSWTVAPVGSRAVVEVQEPKLVMNVSGPDEVLFGRPQLYRFTLTNPGTGVAENVKIELFPPGGGDRPSASNPLGDLPPGKSQTVEVELVARDAGKLAIRAVATAAGDLNTQAAKEVFCRKPELSLDWRGPETKYAGTEATYFLRVRNPGTAAAEDVTVRAILPEGAQFTTASEGQTYDAKRREVAWRVGSLGPGDDSYMELKCTVHTPGANQLRLEATSGTGDLSDKKIAETNVVALADLKLEVSDPSGPVAIGDAAVYEIRVLNRGASAAKDVNIAALFSAGIEPDQADGGQYSVTNGRVAFRPIDELPAGRQAVLKIRAHAVQAGTHVFRAEVLCRDLEIKLAAEETTRFYADEAGTESRQADAASGGPEPVTR
jgi:uncharacterized repeat protein (TIGR01451 family)